MIATATPPSRRVGPARPVVPASRRASPIFSTRCSAISLIAKAAPAAAPAVRCAVPTYATTWKSLSPTPTTARRRASAFPPRCRARRARAPVRPAGPRRQRVRPARGTAGCGLNQGSSPSSGPARRARASAKSSAIRARRAAAMAGRTRRRPCRSTSRPASRTAPGSASPARARPVCVAPRRVIFTFFSPWCRIVSSTGTAPISIAASLSRSPRRRWAAP